MHLPSNLIGLFTKVSLKQTLESSAVASLVEASPIVKSLLRFILHPTKEQRDQKEMP